jgi:hypothetical protein
VARSSNAVSAISPIETIATNGVRRPGRTRPNTPETIPWSAIPYTIREAMIMLMRALFDTAMRAMNENSSVETPSA